METTDDQTILNKHSDCNTNNTLQNCTDRFLESPAPEAVAVPCVFAVILVVGLIGNLLLILSFAQHKSLTTTHNVLVVNLASGDFIFLIVSLPFNSVWYTLSYWPFGLVVCKLSFFAESLATTVVITTLSVLSVERCLIVTGKKLWRQQRREPILLTLGIWALAIAVSMPTLLSATLYEKDTKSVCHIYDPKWGLLYVKIHVGLRFVILFCLPLLVIAVAYTVIAIHLLLRAFPLSDRRRLSGNQNSSKFHSSKKSELKGQDANGSKKQPNTNRKPDPDITSGNGMGDNGTKSKECLIDSKTKFQTRYNSSEKNSNSRKSSTEITQSTPVYPKSFVYTGPIPSMDVPYQRKTSSNETGAKSEDQKTSLTPQAASSKPSKETTPLTTEVRLVGAKFAQPSRPQSMLTKRRRLALTVLMLILAFAICWTPRHIYFLWFFLHPNGSFDEFWHIYQIVAFCLSFSNSAVNPLVFYILDNKYRSYVHASLCALCWKCCRCGQAPGTEAVITLGERDYNATVAPTKSKESVTQL